MATSMHGTGPRHGARDYSQTPLNIYWEMTQACALACRHCRAEAMPEPHPNELTTDEGLAFVSQIPSFGDPLPHLILTGGDPLARKDLYQVIDYARSIGIGISITPAATEALTRDVLVKLKDHGVDGLGLSLDGSTAARHDAIRGVPGTFDRTMNALRWAQELEMPLQVNTLVAEQTADDVPHIFELLKPFSVARWSLFFLISVGRGKVLAALSPEEGEKLMQWVYDVSQDSPFIVATTEAPSYRRVALQRKREQGQDAADMKKSRATGAFGIRDGHGIMFVSNTGDICPAGFLPLTAGNVRQDKIVDIYRDSPLFKQLHDPTTFDGRCGVCEYHILCGGSRARAYGATGNPLAEDPFCPYEPLVPITRA
ncbi:MAG: TIGR04053 family radical SAM/SPASM domain-containing protein [Bryobacterales bacterium]|nr:TIGR04053 family radical SAM/SPASM domain-containing protein [Bryobacterales bacterium]